MFAPIRTTRRELDEDTGELAPPTVVGVKLTPVFHQGQLVAPPDLPAQPKLLLGDDPPHVIWEAVAEQIAAAGYSLRRGPLDGPDSAKGVTNFVERTVTVRDDLEPAQALKTEIHELGHVLMHAAEIREPHMTRDRIEVEAESVAYLVCDILGVDAGTYSIPYVANWAAGDVELVQATAQKVLSIEANIAVLRANGLDDIAITALLTVSVPDEAGVASPLYARDEAVRAVRDPMPIKPLVDQLVADLLVSAGGHPAGARHLAETSGQPTSVINLMEERLRRAEPGRTRVADRRAGRGLALIDEWTAPEPPSRQAEMAGAELASAGQGPEPAA